MQKAIYSPPGEPSIENPDAQRITEDILGCRESIWNSAECFGTIELDGGLAHGSSLTIVYKDGYGYYLEVYLAINGIGSTHRASTGAGYGEVAKVWVGQNYLRIPREFFVSPELTAKIAVTFCQSARLDPCVTWKTSAETGWKFFDPDDQ